MLPSLDFAADCKLITVLATCRAQGAGGGGGGGGVSPEMGQDLRELPTADTVYGGGGD